MHDNFGRGRSSRRRWLWMAVLAAMACIALQATACSGGNSDPAAGGSSRFDKALAYAHCMRSHGIHTFPDPNSQGQLIMAGTVRGASKQTTLAAQNACHRLLESYEMSGGQMSAAQQQHALSQLVKYAECMRAHGVSNYRDPTVSSSGIGFNTAGIPTQSPQFIAAQQACKSLAAKAKS